MTELRIVRRETVTGANLTSNVPETGAEYSASATYALGDTVIDTAGTSPTNKQYESLADGNVGNALTDDTKWLDLGATNRWAMFDNVNGTQTELASDIDVTIATLGQVDCVGLLGLDAEQVQVTLTVDGVAVYDETTSLRNDTYVTDWYHYFFEEIIYDTELIVPELPLYAAPKVRVQIVKSSGTRACGTFVVGHTRGLGLTTYGASVGIRDYSRKETDEFGNTSLVERSYAKRGSFKLYCEAATADANARVLTEYRASPTLWIGTDDYRMTWIFGWAKSWDVELFFLNKSYVTLEIEGLI